MKKQFLLMVFMESEFTPHIQEQAMSLKLK